MTVLDGGDTRGILDAAAGFRHFRLDRRRPGDDLAWAVDRFWMVEWDLRNEDPYDQRVVPHPAVHLVFEAGRAEIQAISPHDFLRRLQNRGHVFGVRFRPAGFRPFLGRPVSTIAGQRLPAAAVFGTEVDDLARLLAETEDGDTQAAAVDAWLRAVGIGPLAMTEAVNGIVAHIGGDRSIIRVDELAARLQTSTRRIQRLFADHVGLGPKWVINRCRVHEAAEIAGDGEAIDWAQLAADLGYSDQSHLVRHFTAAVGSSPGRYSRRAAASRGATPS